MSCQSMPPDTSGTQRDPTLDYTAVVYFHGMGEQRRHEDVSNILKHLDAQHGSLLPGHEVYSERMYVGESEQSTMPPPDAGPKQIVYQRVRNPLWRGIGDNDSGIHKTVRFYEAYWAPHSVGGTNVVSILRWLVGQWFKPILVLASPWREYQAVRLSTLAGIYEDQYVEVGLDNENVRILQALSGVYRDFGAPECDTDAAYRPGTFKQFLTYLKANPDLGNSINLSTMARRWHRKHLWEQWLYFWLLFISLVGVAGTLGVVWWAFVTLFFNTFPGLWATFISILPSGLKDFFEPQIITQDNMRNFDGPLSEGSRNINILLSLVALGVLAGVAFFARPLRDWLGDVQQYVTYEETNAKYARHEAILNDTTAVLRHVLNDKHCQRVVVIAHSLGSVIAYDALLQISRRARLAPPQAKPDDMRKDLTKIRHFITYGSPINKTTFFFATIRSRTPRYVDVSRKVRGDIGALPFTYPHIDQPHIHWVNFWDQGDIVSGPLLSTIGRRIATERVENVRVARHILPNPADSHTGYLKHRRIRHDVSAMIFANSYSSSSTVPMWFDAKTRQAYLPMMKKGQRPFLMGTGAVCLLVIYGLLVARIWQLASAIGIVLLVMLFWELRHFLVVKCIWLLALALGTVMFVMLLWQSRHLLIAW